MNTDTTEREPHVLDKLHIRQTKARDWNERVKEWYRPLTFDQRIAWLQSNVVRSGNGPEQFIFYLELADGHGVDNFSMLAKHQEIKSSTLRGHFTLARQKTLLSRKAFVLLCQEFFAKKENQQSQFPHMLPYQEPLFSKLLWFFRGSNDSWHNLRPSSIINLGRDGGKHYLETANDFAKEFVRNAWQMLNGYWYNYWECDPPALATAQKHWREIIALLRRYDLLDHVKSGQFTPSPDIFMKMVQIAHEEDGPFPGPFEYQGSILGTGTMLERLASGNDRFAQVLYIARLHVESEHNSTQRRRHLLLK